MYFIILQRNPQNFSSPYSSVVRTTVSKTVNMGSNPIKDTKIKNMTDISILKYYHGSTDSLDKDVFIVLPKLPIFLECKKICDSNKKENVNLIVINNGYVTDCYKGTCDEIHNSLINTYDNHEQHFPLILYHKVERDIILKHIRVMRCFLSYFSKTYLRQIVKSALTSKSFKKRIDVLKELDFSIKDFGKNNRTEIFKTFAFQLAQVLGLYKDIEIYTKKDSIKYFPELNKYIYRHNNCSEDVLIEHFNNFIKKSEELFFIEQNDFIIFPEFNRKVNLKLETSEKNKQS